MISINTRFDENDGLLKKLDMLCVKNKRSRSFMVKKGIEYLIEKSEKEKPISIDEGVLEDFRKHGKGRRF